MLHQNGLYLQSSQEHPRKPICDYSLSNPAATNSSPFPSSSSSRPRPIRPSIFSLPSPSELLDTLPQLNIDLLDCNDRDNLRYLSLQYQFHLRLYEQHLLPSTTNSSGICSSAEKFKDNEKYLNQ